MRKDEITVVAIKHGKLYLSPCYCMSYLSNVYGMKVCTQSNSLSVSYIGALGSPLLSLHSM